MKCTKRNLILPLNVVMPNASFVIQEKFAKFQQKNYYKKTLNLKTMRIKLTIEVEIEDSFGMEEEEKLWFENEVLVGDGSLVLHSNDIGDTVGVIKAIKNLKYLG